MDHDAGDVLILATGYATDALWLAAVVAATAAGRTGRAVARDGEVLTLAEAIASAC